MAQLQRGKISQVIGPGVDVDFPPGALPTLLTALKVYLKLQQLSADWESIEGAPDERLITSLSMICPFSCREKQALLESSCLADRARVLTALLEMAVLEGAGPDAQPN